MSSSVKVGQFLVQSTKVLAATGVSSARLDSLIFLEKVLNRDRAWLLAHPEQRLSERQVLELAQMLAKRSWRIPLAYITGYAEFFGREFKVTPSVLIPRPETELILELMKSWQLKNGSRLLDVGTGSGAIAVTAALEIPGLKVEACDTSAAALKIAKRNAGSLGADFICFFISDLAAKAGVYDVIAANLPYVSKDWERSPETNYEPSLALFAKDGGLELINKLVTQAPAHLESGGRLILEADPRQHSSIKKTAAIHGFKLLCQKSFIICFTKS